MSDPFFKVDIFENLKCFGIGYKATAFQDITISSWVELSRVPEALFCYNRRQEDLISLALLSLLFEKKKQVLFLFKFVYLKKKT